jgi:anti-sigma-K factor RskA
MTHAAFREMIPLYVIGALDGDELYNFERYVAENREKCHIEIAEYQAVADQLALAAPSAEPSPSVYEHIAAAIESGEHPQEAAAPAAPVSAPSRPAVAERPRREAAGLGTIFFRIVPWAAAAMLVYLLIDANNQIHEREDLLQSTITSYNELLGNSREQLGKVTQQRGSLAELTSRLDAQAKEFKEKLDQLHAANEAQQHDIDTLRAANKGLEDEKDSVLRAADQMRQQLEKQTLQTAALQRKIDGQTDSLDLMMDPATRVASLVDPKAESKAVARVYWQNVKKAGFMVVSNLAPVAQTQGKCLELWAICGDAPPVPAGIGWTDDTGHGVLQVKLAKEMSCIDKFAVTVERNGGAPAPEGSIILAGQ